MKVLLTGSNGLVGKNVLEHPRINEFYVLIPTSTELNLLNCDAVEQFLKKEMPDIIIHAAGKVGGIVANMQMPVKFLLDNLDMGRNIIWAARQTGIKRLINLGTSCMYPRNAPDLLKEEMLLTGELEPTNEGYALAKLTVARLCEYINKEHQDYHYKTLIPCNLYGRWDKFDPKVSHMIPGVIRRVFEAKKQKAQTVEIWGDGMVKREFMYAGDLADCLIHALHNFDSLPSVMNVGLGFDYTIKEYYSAISEVLEYKGHFLNNEDKPVGMKRKVVDITRQKQWGWEAKTGLKEGIKKTYDFFLTQDIV
ncbi:MAG: GDP-L-fucose synthase [Thiomargarita sp.]|nr:GDP-L-fucose synthase [Thiomargarita sp.]